MNSHSRNLLAFALLVAVVATPVHAQQTSYYVLDGFGGVHAGGNAPGISGTPYFGFDVARDIAIVADEVGAGILMLDGFGGVHPAGLGNPPMPATPYFGFDIARAIEPHVVSPRVAGVSDTTTIRIATTSATYSLVESVTINAPAQGFLLVIARAMVACLTDFPTDALTGELTINVNATTEPTGINNTGLATWPDCTKGGGNFVPTNNQTLVQLFPVSPGNHTVNLLARKAGGSATAEVFILGRSLNAVFVQEGQIAGS